VLESYHKLQQKPIFKSLKNKCTSVDLVCIPEKAIDNSMKDYRKRLQACVSANGGHFEQILTVIFNKILFDVTSFYENIEKNHEFRNKLNRILLKFKGSVFSQSINTENAYTET